MVGSVGRDKCDEKGKKKGFRGLGGDGDTNKWGQDTRVPKKQTATAACNILLLYIRLSSTATERSFVTDLVFSA